MAKLDLGYFNIRNQTINDLMSGTTAQLACRISLNTAPDEKDIFFFQFPNGKKESDTLGEAKVA